MSKKGKLIAIYAVLVVFVVLIILGFCLPKSYMPEIKAPYTISVTTTSGQSKYDGMDIENNKKRYDEFYKKFEDATKESFLGSLFTGNLFFFGRIELLTSAPSYSGYKLMFKYSEEQTVMYKGKEYAHSTDSSTVLKYTKLYFDVVETNGISTVSMYYEVPTVINETNSTVYYKRTVLANFDEIYSDFNANL